jgi:hypothetical protein
MSFVVKALTVAGELHAVASKPLLSHAASQVEKEDE